MQRLIEQINDPKDSGALFKYPNSQKLDSLLLIIHTQSFGLIEEKFEKNKPIYQKNIEEHILRILSFDGVPFARRYENLINFKTEKGFFLLSLRFRELFEKAKLSRSQEELDATIALFYPELDPIASSPFLSPEAQEHINPSAFFLKRMLISDGGDSFDNWSPFFDELLRSTSFSHLPLPETPTTLPSVIESKPCALDLSKLSDEGWGFYKLLGRTILLTNEAGDFLAIKVMKTSEKLEDLERELLLTQTFKEENELKSYIPQPRQVAVIKNIPNWIQENKPEPGSLTAFNKLTALKNESQPYCYIYFVDREHSGYFKYVTDKEVTQEEFAQACRITVIDLVTLLKKGYTLALAPMYHQIVQDRVRKDQGLYVVLANILSDERHARDLYLGSGQLQGWLKTVEHSNIRAGGLADLGDIKPYPQFFKRFEHLKISFSRCSADSWLFNAATAEIIAEYLYVLFLCAGKRGHDLAIDHPKIWEAQSQQVVANAAQMLSLLASLEEKSVHSFLLKSIDVQRIARQMQFWMTREYIQALEQKQIPAGVYDPKTEVSISLFRQGTYTKELGFSINGKDADLGPVNGQECIKEVNKLIYLVLIGIYWQCRANHILSRALKVKEYYLQREQEEQQEAKARKPRDEKPKNPARSSLAVGAGILVPKPPKLKPGPATKSSRCSIS